ncbi:hypothetical protein [Streptomyces sp. cg36]|uniref:hypothetical protein n=1 Tax=Streptomyces sp. cg36 TaxID=3238798 RepID=UPI0034E2CB86
MSPAIPAPNPPVEPVWLKDKNRSEDAVAAREADCVSTRIDFHHEVDGRAVLARMGTRADGTETVLHVHVMNPDNWMVGTIAPLDKDGGLWLARTTHPDTVELSKHATPADAVDHIKLDAEERGAWAATTMEELDAAWLANPRTPLCEHCGR